MKSTCSGTLSEIRSDVKLFGNLFSWSEWFQLANHRLCSFFFRFRSAGSRYCWRMKFTLSRAVVTQAIWLLPNWRYLSHKLSKVFLLRLHGRASLKRHLTSHELSRYFFFKVFFNRDNGTLAVLLLSFKCVEDFSVYFHAIHETLLHVWPNCMIRVIKAQCTNLLKPTGFTER